MDNISIALNIVKDIDFLIMMWFNILRVSGEVPVSEDDEDEQDNNSYDDSFIDDRINPTAGSTQAEASRSDMMAVYRYFMSINPYV